MSPELQDKDDQTVLQEQIARMLRQAHWADCRLKAVPDAESPL